MKMIGNVSDWLSYAGGALIKVADSAGSTVPIITRLKYLIIVFIIKGSCYDSQNDLLQVTSL